MDHELNCRLNYEIEILSDTRNNYASRLASLSRENDTVLKTSKKKGGKTYYYAHRRGYDHDCYLGDSDDPEVIRIREARFLREAVKRLDKNISLIRSFNQDYQSYDPNDINGSLPLIYRDSARSFSRSYDDKGSEWLEKQLEFQKQFPENHPEQKTMMTSDGIPVKNVSEQLVYERFKSAGFYQVYELPLVFKDYGPQAYPDFSILSPIDMKTKIIVEYVGRLDLHEYRLDFANRVQRYIRNGYIPGINLFFIFGDAKGRVDSAQISKVISDIKGLAS